MEKYKLSQSQPAGSKPKRRAKPAKRSFAVAQSSWQIYAAAGGVVLVAAGLGISALLHHNKPSHTPNSSPTAPGSSQGSTTKSVTPSGPTSLSPSDRSSVTSAIETKQPSGVLSRLAPGARVVVAGSRLSYTPAQALALLNNATNPWNWSLPSGTLAQWQNGPYGQYFTGGELVGMSANGEVISLAFDSSGQITTIFIATSSDQLLPPDSSSSPTPGSQPTGPDSNTD